MGRRFRLGRVYGPRFGFPPRFTWHFGALGCLVPAVLFLSVSLWFLLTIAR